MNLRSTSLENKQRSNRGSVEHVLRSLRAVQQVEQEIRAQGYSLDKSDLKRLLAELTGSISEAKMDLNFLQNNIGLLEYDIRRLEGKLYQKSNLRRRGDAYYKTLESGRPYGQPFCSYCWEKDQEQYHLHNKVLNKDVRVCPHCKNEFQTVRTPYFEADPTEL